MSNREQNYQCPTCKATKTITQHPTQSDESFQQEIPDSLPCMYRGCHDRAVKVIMFEPRELEKQ